VLDVFGPRATRPRRRQAVARSAAPPPARAPKPSRRLPREVLVNDARGRRTVPLRESLTVGRAASCDLVVDDNYVSNVHARIFLRDGSYFIEDLGSTNGTYMNRTKVAAPVAIRPGDEVRMGKATLELRR
jgi:pSer/pThr/pTyr-binding forkhead associated (FHA) protein